MFEPIPAADSEESYIDELLVNPTDRPVAIVTRYEDGVGYPTYATTRLSESQWSEVELIAPDFVHGRRLRSLRGFAHGVRPI